MKTLAILALAAAAASALAACGHSGPRYSSDALGFAINHPAGTEIRVETDQRVKFVVPGDAATPDASGFTLTVLRAAGVPVRASLGAYADAVMRRSHARGMQILSGPTRIQLGDYHAVRYRGRSESGKLVVRYLLAPQIGRFYSITVQAARDGQTARAADMLASLTFSPAAETAEVQVALLETPAAEPEAGCDTVVFETFEPPSPGQPLAMALEALFALHSNKVRGHRNFIARTKPTLRLGRVVRDGHTARIDLVGELTGLRGVCDNPRAAIQIRQTALQVDGIQRVELFLNGQPTDLRPNARGRRAAATESAPSQ